MEARRARWEDRVARRHYRSGSHGLFFGAIVVAVGCLLLLDNLGIVRFHDIWQYWPVLLVAFGVSRIVDSRTPSGWIWGGMVTLVGAFLLLDTLDIIAFQLRGGLAGTSDRVWRERAGTRAGTQSIPGWRAAVP